MPKSSPEKLAKALRANLKKRKSEGRPAPKDMAGSVPGEAAANTPHTPADPPEKPANPSEKPGSRD